MLRNLCCYACFAFFSVVALVQGQQIASITGTVDDSSGAPVSGAKVVLSRDGRPLGLETVTSADGHFSFSNLPAGPFSVTVTLSGFAPGAYSGILAAAEISNLPQIVLQVAPLVSDVEVTMTQKELAQEQIKLAETQRVLGAIPNYYVNYDHQFVPLTSGQKFQLAWKTLVDPFSLGVNAAVAGVQQSRNRFSGFGQGSEGYAKRFGANYGDFVSGVLLTGAILPSLLKQDPRYFYKGTGSKRSRFIYAVENAVICKGDNGRWQPNYSSILGGLAAGGISNLYYPAKNRDGAGLTFENAGFEILGNAGAAIFQEFFSKKLTPHSPHN